MKSWWVSKIAPPFYKPFPSRVGFFCVQPQTVFFAWFHPIIYFRKYWEMDQSVLLEKAEQVFTHYVDQIELGKVSEIAIRRALKKYDVKNLKINNVTPLRAKKIYGTILPKYWYLKPDTRRALPRIKVGYKTSEDCSFGVLFATSSNTSSRFRVLYSFYLCRKMKILNFFNRCSHSKISNSSNSKSSASSRRTIKIQAGAGRKIKSSKRLFCNHCLIQE